MKKYQDSPSSAAHCATHERTMAARLPRRRAGATAATQRTGLLNVLQSLLYLLPIVLFFSYHPRIPLGSTSSMNLELSLPLIWLFVFAALSIPTLPRSIRQLYQLMTIPRSKEAKHNTNSAKTTFSRLLILLLFAFPTYLTISLFWSPNFLRGLLTVGIFWCLIISTLTIITLMLKKDIKIKIVKITILASVIVSLFCWLQCILDILNVPRDATLLCSGCTYHSFGFPHPNGFAIEPQFMGNLLLAPCFLALYLFAKSKSAKNSPAKITKPATPKTSIFHRPKILLFITILLLVTLFLTFSRGAIYAFYLGLFALIVARLIQTKSPQPLKLILPVLCSFLVALLAQGTLAQLSPTSDTFADGINKVISQLSLGHINLKPAEDTENSTSTTQYPNPYPENAESSDDTEANEPFSGGALRRSRPSYSGATPATAGGRDHGDAENGSLTSNFDGYVPESTEIRVRLTDYALDLWNDSPEKAIFGTGLASSGTALYEKFPDLGSPKEIVQNEYATLLLETGLVGCSLLIVAIVIILKYVITILPIRERTYLLALALAFAATLFFFSGLPNALHIYLLPALLFACAHLSPRHR